MCEPLCEHTSALLSPVHACTLHLMVTCKSSKLTAGGLRLLWEEAQLAVYYKGGTSSLSSTQQCIFALWTALMTKPPASAACGYFIDFADELRLTCAPAALLPVIVGSLLQAGNRRQTNHTRSSEAEAALSLACRASPGQGLPPSLSGLGHGDQKVPRCAGSLSHAAVRPHIRRQHQLQQTPLQRSWLMKVYFTAHIALQSRRTLPAHVDSPGSWPVSQPYVLGCHRQAMESCSMTRGTP